ncbi:4a-hydroxytetrahydrobiopterin dehydratase [Marinimicrobium agarilyticum]|uniref:4a-hydroxytetrahydrobiopterin dehydratase n=1 Tax=Marinimicrobium agarilyticum TaxID=306546 RepID=UPI000421E53E|nr:4a-hydroxytetrahydrobiopterin dehydratase [Marinimicrobium agarilyticum]
MSDLAQQSCEACKSDAPTLSDAEINAMKPDVPEWEVKEIDGEKRLSRRFKFKNFAEALAFTQTVGDLAEDADHHPAILTEYGKVTVDWWTHKIGGLHKNDFVMAAKTDKAYT